jgi:hypothetical protein
MLVIGQQRIVGAEQCADIAGMMQPDIEISVIPDAEGQMQRAVADRMKVRGQFQPATQAGQLGEQGMAQRQTIRRRQRKERIERGLAQGVLRRLGHHLGDGMQVQHQIADGRADPRRAPVQRKHPQRQVLHGEIGVFIGTRHPG